MVPKSPPILLKGGFMLYLIPKLVKREYPKVRRLLRGLLVPGKNGVSWFWSIFNEQGYSSQENLAEALQ
jgi:hypothetical protein